MINKSLIPTFDSSYLVIIIKDLPKVGIKLLLSLARIFSLYSCQKSHFLFLAFWSTSGYLIKVNPNFRLVISSHNYKKLPKVHRVKLLLIISYQSL